jgi:hypothetical protein
MLKTDTIEQYNEDKYHTIWIVLNEDCGYDFLASSHIVSANHPVNIAYDLVDSNQYQEADIRYDQLQYYLNEYSVFQVSLSTDFFGITLSGAEAYIGSGSKILTLGIYNRLTGTFLN